MIVQPTYQDHRLNVFKKKIGDEQSEKHFLLAFHAAVPVALTSDLLYKLWLNFQTDQKGKPLNIPLTCVADLLASPICRQIGYDLFEIYPTVKKELIRELEASDNLGIPRKKRIAKFLLAYVEFNTDKIPSMVFKEALNLVSLSIVDPAKAAEKVFNTLDNQKLSTNEKIAQVNTQLSFLETPRISGEEKGGIDKSFLDVEIWKKVFKALHDYNSGRTGLAKSELIESKEFLKKSLQEKENAYKIPVKEQLLKELKLRIEEEEKEQIIEQTEYFEEALKRIREARLSRQDRLDLSELGLRQIPKEFQELIDVKDLNLSGNQIKDLSPLKNFTRLTHLYLGSNQIKDLSPLGGLMNLTFLRLDSNQIVDLSALKDLVQLTFLDLGENRIQDLSPLRYLTSLKSLYLDHNQINNIDALEDVTQLRDLILIRNQIKDLSPLSRLGGLNYLNLFANQILDINSIASLIQLKKLDLGDNQIKDLSPLRNLIELSELHLDSNQFVDISSLENLVELTVLWLNDNQLTDIGSLNKTKKLVELSLENNLLSNISILENHKELKTLNLINNKIESIPRWLVEREMEISFEPGYKEKGKVYLDNNPITKPPLRVAVEGKEAILAYFNQSEQEKRTKLNEAKVVFLGSGGAGKTSLITRIHGDEFQATKSAIPGLKINQWTVSTNQNDDLIINLWDLGKQEIMNGTFQFFLTQRTLYIYVWNAQEEASTIRMRYWLDVIHRLAPGAPVIIVQNKIDLTEEIIDKITLQRQFSNIVAFEEVSVVKNLRINTLRETIIREARKLPHIGDELPKNWKTIRKELGELKQNFITLQTYLDICNQNGLNKSQALFLSEYFHDLGIFLHFQHLDSTQNTIFLNPNWFSSIIHSLSRDRQIRENYARIGIINLHKIWSQTHGLSRKLTVQFVSLMEYFELCFKIRQDEQVHYLIPSLLYDVSHDYDWDDTGNLNFRYSYEFMPHIMLIRFIVKAFHLIKDELYWSRGVVIENQEDKAEIVQTNLQTIDVKINGNEKVQFLGLIRNYFREIHAGFENLEVKELVPCKCQECIDNSNPHFFEYQRLIDARKKGRKQIHCPESDDLVSIGSLLGYDDNAMWIDSNLRINPSNIDNLDQLPPGIEPLDLNKWENKHENFIQKLTKGASFKLRLPQSNNKDLAEMYHNTTKNFQWLIQHAITHSIRLRALGSGWSFSKVAVTNGGLIDTKALNLSFRLGEKYVNTQYKGNGGTKNGLLFVQCGNTILELNEKLEKQTKPPRCLKTTGASNGTTIAGAISTGTHGSAYKFGSMQDMVVGLHVIVGADRHVYMERASNPVVTEAFANWLGAELIRDDDLFNSVLVSFGSFGFIHGLLLETDPIFHLKKHTIQLPYNDALRQSINSLDFFNLKIPGLNPSSDDIYHFEVIVNPHDFKRDDEKKGVIVRFKSKLPYDETIQKKSNKDSRFSYGDDALGIVDSVIQAMDKVSLDIVPLLMRQVFSSVFKVENSPEVGTIGEFFGTAKVQGKVASCAIGVPIHVTSKILEFLIELNQKQSFPGFFALRFVKKSEAILAFTRFDQTCIIELDGIDSRRTREFYNLVLKRLDGLSVPYTLHWGKMNDGLTPGKVLKMYGEETIEKWLACRNTLLSKATQEVFSNDFMKQCGLIGK